MANDLPAAMPSSVTIVFPVLWQGAPQYAPYTVLGQTFSAPYVIQISLASLNLTGISPVVGFTGTKTIHDTATAVFLPDPDTGLPVIQNATELLGLAMAIARDWYLYRAGQANSSYVGAVPWVMEGLTDLVEFAHTTDTINTIVERGPWLEHVEDLQHYGQGGSLPQPCDCAGNITIIDITNEINYYNIQNIEIEYLTVTIINNYTILIGPPLCTVPVTSVQTDIDCVNTPSGQVLVLSHRTRTQSVVNGCLTAPVDGPWVPYKYVQCCMCPSGSGTPSGSGIPSGSGVCIPGICAYCANPPYLWAFDVVGFSGTCDAFNTFWSLTNTGPCTWSASYAYAGQTATATITLNSSSQWVLVFTYGPAGNPISQATYTYQRASQSMDCCSDIVFELPNPEDCQCGSGAGPLVCTECSPGVTPVTWSVTLAGFAGPCAVFNGTWVLAQSAVSPCIWTLKSGTLTFGFDPQTTTSSVFSCTDSSTGAQVFYGESGVFLGNCCEPVTIDLQSAVGAPGCNAPGSVTLTPDCGISPCQYCPNSQTPNSWTFAISAQGGCFTDFIGDWSVPLSAACQYSFISGSVSIFILITTTGSLELTMNGANGTANYISSSMGGNCCNPVLLNLVAWDCSNGMTVAPPATLILTPDCSDVAPGGCPESITAVPTCCGSSSGSGSGSDSGSGGGITFPCCPGVTLPSTLTMNVSGTIGCDGDYTLYYDGVDNNYYMPSFGTCSPETIAEFTWQFNCDPLGGTWSLDINVGSGLISYSPDIDTNFCSPLEVKFTNVRFGCGCSFSGPFGATITITLP
jgi:hypothetical protein